MYKIPPPIPTPIPTKPPAHCHPYSPIHAHAHAYTHAQPGPSKVFSMIKKYPNARRWPPAHMSPTDRTSISFHFHLQHSLRAAILRFCYPAIRTCVFMCVSAPPTQFSHSLHCEPHPLIPRTSTSPSPSPTLTRPKPTPHPENHPAQWVCVCAKAEPSRAEPKRIPGRKAQGKEKKEGRWIRHDPRGKGEKRNF